MTPEQHRVLVFVNRYMRIRHGISPTYDEIAAGVGLQSKSGVHRLLAGLKDQGFVDWMPHRRRCLEVLRMPDPSEVPLSEISELRARVETLEQQVTDILSPNVIPMKGRVR